MSDASNTAGERKKKRGSSGHGFSSKGYRDRKKTSARGHTLQSQKRADRLRSKQFMKKFTGNRKKKILV